jgi:hypothetical protein
MIAEQDRLIIAKYPDIFDLASGPSGSAMSLGFQLNGSGWLALLERLFADLQLLAVNVRIQGGEFKVLQVKQKLGTLRVTYTGGNDDIEGRIHQAKTDALRTCEICGGPGEQRSDHGYLIIRCPTCHWIGGQDINFDGWLNLLFMTERGAANSKAEYWVYDPAADRFRDLGEFPMFRVDAVHKRLSTYVGNGPAGLDFEERDYAFEGNDLIVKSEETQEPSPSRPGWYVHTVRHRKDGKLVVVLRETVKQPPTP